MIPLISLTLLSVVHCPSCDKSFSRKHGLARHFRTSEGCKREKEYRERKAQGTDTVTVVKKLQRES